MRMTGLFNTDIYGMDNIHVRLLHCSNLSYINVRVQQC